MQIMCIKGTTKACGALILYQSNLTQQCGIYIMRKQKTKNNTIPVALAISVLNREYVMAYCTYCNDHTLIA